jgi:hypothetical protein
MQGKHITPQYNLPSLSAHPEAIPPMELACIWCTGVHGHEKTGGAGGRGGGAHGLLMGSAARG